MYETGFGGEGASGYDVLARSWEAISIRTTGGSRWKQTPYA
jgi:hypothetical protein